MLSPNRITFCHFPGHPMCIASAHVVFTECLFLVFWPNANFLPTATCLPKSPMILPVSHGSLSIVPGTITSFLIIELYFVSFLGIYFSTRVKTPVVDFTHVSPAFDIISGTINTVNAYWILSKLRLDWKWHFECFCDICFSLQFFFFIF